MYGGGQVTIRGILGTAGVTLVAGLGLGPAGAAAGTSPAAPNFTWSGQADTGLWSSAGNWQGAVAPSGTVGTLSFPALTCTPAVLCRAQTDVENVSAAGLNIDDASGYVISPLTAGDSAEALAIGAGGLTATTQASAAPGGTPVLGPVTFSGSETWTIDGGPAGVGALTVGQITGSPSGTGTLHVTTPAIGLDLADQGLLTLAGNGVDNELGALTVTGRDTSATGAGAIANGTIDFSSSGGALNAVSRTPLSLDDVALIGAASLGPLSATGSLIGFTVPGSGGTTQVNGNATFGGASVLDLPFASTKGQLNATGQIALNGVSLNLLPGTPRCPSLAAGAQDVILTAVGGISGTFSGMPNGAQVTLKCVGQAPTLRISYSTLAVTATVLSAGGPAYPTSVALTGPASPPTVGQSMQLSAGVAPGPAGGANASEPAGTVTFFVDHTAIPGCGSATLNSSGSAQVAVCTLNAPSGAHDFTATYTPSSPDWAAATSNALTIRPTPAPAPTATTPKLTPAPAPTPVATATSTSATSTVRASAAPLATPVMKLSAGQDPANPQLLSDTATLTPASRRSTAVVSGQVSFYDGSFPIPGCQGLGLSGGRVNCTTGLQTPGAQTITAVYGASSAFSAASAHATARSSLATPTASFTRFSTRTPALSLSVRSFGVAFTGFSVAFLTPGLSFDAYAALMTSSGRLSVARGALALGLAHPAARASFGLGTGAVKLTHSLPAHGAILTLVSLTFAHRPGAQLLLSLPR